MSTIIPATREDIPELVTLLQSSFRGDKGWCRDTHLLEGTRVTAEMIEKDMLIPGRVLWKCVSEDSKVILGCVYTEKKPGSDIMYTGTLSVHPDYQICGIGKKLMKYVEEKGKELKCCAIRLDVIISQQVLVKWYERRGYRILEGSKPFPEDTFGKFKVPPEMLALITMQKDLINTDNLTNNSCIN